MWGARFRHISGDFKVVRVVFPKSMVKSFNFKPKLDGIGPAYYAYIEQLRDVIINPDEIDP